MHETPCPEHRRLVAFHRGELPKPQADEIAAHLRVCPVCRAVLGAGLDTVELELHHGQKAESQPLSAPAPRPPAWPPGTSAAPGPAGYRLLEEIGRGAVGVVYRAHDVRLDRTVAVKVLREDHLLGSIAALRFMAEARTAARLPHPGIPAVHELGLLPDGRPFLVMRLVEGQTLQDLLQQRASLSADLDRLLDIFHHLCQAVACAHAHRIIHRDLKPQNVMVGAFGEVQVMDWGLAKTLGVPNPLDGHPEPQITSPLPASDEPAKPAEYATRHGAVLGTPAYMAPEQAAGQVERLDLRTDVFSLGAILYQILTGSPPYGSPAEAESSFPAQPAALDEALARLDHCQAETDLVVLCKQCLAAYQDDRPADAQAVADAIEHVRSAARERLRRAELEKEQALVRQAEQCRQRKQLLVLAAVAVGLLLLAWIMASITAARHRDTPRPVPNVPVGW